MNAPDMDSSGQSVSSICSRMEKTCIERSNCALYVFHFSLFFGIFPYRLKNGLFCISIPFCIVSLMIAIGLVYFTVLNSILPFFNEPLTKQNVARYCYFITLCSLHLITLMTSFSRARSINEIIRALDDVDELLLSADFYKRVRLQTKIKIKDGLCAVICLIIILHSCFLKSPLVILSWTYYSIIATSAALTGFQFSALGSLITCRLNAACAVLNDLKIVNRVSMRLEKITSLSAVQNDLSDACSVLAKSFSTVLTVHTSVCFFGLTVGTFFAISIQTNLKETMGNFWITSGIMELPSVFIRLISLSLSFVSTWQVVNSSSEMCKMIKDFDTLLYDLMINDKTNEISSSNKLRLHIIMKREVKFTASGLFNLDYTLLHSLVSAAATYLVILLQLQQPRTSPGSELATAFTIWTNTTYNESLPSDTQ